MKFKIKNNKYYKFLTGMFVPADKILAPEVKIHKNLYKALPDLEFTEFKNNILDSFGKNCKGSGSDLRFSSNY